MALALVGVDEDVEKHLLRMAEDENVPDHLRLGALKQLAMFLRSRPAPPPPAQDGGRPELLRGLGLDEPEEARELPADPMRDLDFGYVVGRTPHPLFYAWTRVIPRDLSRRELLAAEQTFLRRARAAGVTTGPDGDPPQLPDDLSRRRRKGS